MVLSGMQALLGQGKFDAAAADLQVAYDAAPTDQRDMIQAALKDAESRRSSSRTSLSAVRFPQLQFR